MARFFSINILVILFLSFFFTEGVMDKKIALVIASKGFQPLEYEDTKKVLEAAGVQVDTISEKTGKSEDAFGQDGPIISLTVNQVNPRDYDGIFLIGGSGALDCLDNENVYKLMRVAKEAGIFYGAICVSPRILCKAGLINDKKITGWDGDSKLQEECPDVAIMKVGTTNADTVTDGKLITGRDPLAAKAFGEAIVKALKS